MKIRRKKLNPLYRKYCSENGMTPAEMLAHDKSKYPGGFMAGFIIWVTRRNENVSGPNVRRDLR